MASQHPLGHKTGKESKCWQTTLCRDGTGKTSHDLHKTMPENVMKMPIDVALARNASSFPHDDMLFTTFLNVYAEMVQMK